MQKHIRDAVVKPVTREWRPLCAAMALLVGRSEEAAEEVLRDHPESSRNIALVLAVRGIPVVEPFDEAWLRLRAWIEDGKVPARGTAVDRRRRVGDPVTSDDTTFTHSVLPPEQAAGLVPWNEPSSGETWLRPSDLTIFGQGRHWKSVEVHWASLLSVAAEEANPSSSNAPAYREIPPEPRARKRGRKPRKLQLAIDALSQLPREELDAMQDKELEDRFRGIAGRTWLKKAREMVLQGISGK
jgi:hypothetical protein